MPAPRRDHPGRFLDAVASVARSAAIPYGYTATLWATGAATTEHLDPPALADALAYVAGAWLAFVVARLAVRRREGDADEPGTRRTVRAGALQIVPVAAGVTSALVVLVATGLSGWAGWAVTGWVATLVFLALVSLDLALLPE